MDGKEAEIYEAQPSVLPEPMETAIIWAENRKTVKMRAQPTTSCRLYDELPVGTLVEITAYDCVVDSKGNHWTRVNHTPRQGWYIMSRFLAY